MDPEARIRQFETMVRPEADPNNDMAWFSLAKAYADGGRHADAAAAYTRCTELNRDFSKAWQLAGQEYMTAGEPDKAAAALTEGYKVASARGDRMPMQAMGELLKKLGKPVPEVANKPGAGRAQDSGPRTQDSFVCRRTGRPGTRIARPPFRGPLGAWIQKNIAKETFDAWIAQGTKVINEMRLDLSREQDSDVYDAHMREYLGIDDDLHQQIAQGKA